jgi:hypothetical protein
VADTAFAVPSSDHFFHARLNAASKPDDDVSELPLVAR